MGERPRDIRPLAKYADQVVAPLEPQQPYGGGINKPELQPPKLSNEAGPTSSPEGKVRSHESLPESREERLALFRELHWKREVPHHLRKNEYFAERLNRLCDAMARASDDKVEQYLSRLLAKNDIDKRVELLEMSLSEAWFMQGWVPRKLSVEQQKAIWKRVHALPEEELDAVIDQEYHRLEEDGRRTPIAISITHH